VYRPGGNAEWFAQIDCDKGKLALRGEFRVPVSSGDEARLYAVANGFWLALSKARKGDHVTVVTDPKTAAEFGPKPEGLIGKTTAAVVRQWFLNRGMTFEVKAAEGRKAKQ
jgi:hypothetical protein